MGKENKKTQDNQESWKKVLDYFYYKEELDNESYKHLNSFLDTVEINYLLKDVIETKEDIEIIEYLENIFKELDRMFLERDTFEIKDECLKELKKQLAVNEDKYMKEAYNRTKCHYILHEMFKTAGKRMEQVAYKRAQYRNYGKNNFFDYGYHCLSPFLDLVISNVSRGTLYKNIPKDMTGKAEYVYDEKGQLILYKKNKEKIGNVSYLQFLIYGKEETVSLLYMVIEDEYWLHDVGIQYYENEQIILNDIVVWGMGEKVQDINLFKRESYIYENGVLKNAWREQLNFPCFLSPREFYTFRYDEEGFISEYLRREFWGDGERSLPWGEHYTPIPEKKKKDTGKDSSRWKRPNYFNVKLS